MARAATSAEVIDTLSETLSALTPGTLEYSVISAELFAAVAEEAANNNPTPENVAAAQSARADAMQAQQALEQADSVTTPGDATVRDGVGVREGSQLAPSPPSFDLGINLGQAPSLGPTGREAQRESAAALRESMRSAEDSRTEGIRENARGNAFSTNHNLRDDTPVQEQIQTIETPNPDDGFLGINVQLPTQEQLADWSSNADAREAARESSRGEAFKALSQEEPTPFSGLAQQNLDNSAVSREQAASALAAMEQANERGDKEGFAAAEAAFGSALSNAEKSNENAATAIGMGREAASAERGVLDGGNAFGGGRGAGAFSPSGNAFTAAIDSRETAPSSPTFTEKSGDAEKAAEAPTATTNTADAQETGVTASTPAAPTENAFSAPAEQSASQENNNASSSQSSTSGTGFAGLSSGETFGGQANNSSSSSQSSAVAGWGADSANANTRDGGTWGSGSWGNGHAPGQSAWGEGGWATNAFGGVTSGEGTTW